MNFSEFFIRRPIATSLLMLGIAMFGIVSYQALPVSDMPNVDFPTLSVGASLPGADPATMASAVATPLERQFTGIAGLDSMSSTSSTGSTSITLQFDLARKIDGAAVDVQTAISAATPLLPPGISSPPSFRKQNPADSPIMFLALTSETIPLYKLDEYAETMVAQRVSMVSGVAQVNVMGAMKYAVHIQVDPRKLATRQIGLDEVASAVQSWNSNLPTGTLYGKHTAYNVETNGQLMNAAAFRPMVVTYRNGAPVRLQDISNVIDSVEDDKNTTWIANAQEEHKAINLMIMRQPGSNTIEVTDAIKKLIPTFQAMLPPAVSLTVRGDRSKNIREAFLDIKYTMMITLILVIGVIFVFLRNVSATMIPAMALPFSIVGTFAAMYCMNYSLDNLSMMALILSVGFVVDDAIVMLENVVRHVERGVPPMQAALRGSREISFTIISMTISLAAVFIPLLFMGGILGRLFREFAVTICVAVLISGFVSVTLTPMLCSRLLRAHKERVNRNVLARMTESFFDRLNRGYGWSLSWVLRHRPVMGVVFVAVVAATAYLYVIVPKGFIPETDNDQLSVTTEAAQGTSYREMVRIQQRVNHIIQQDPNLDTYMSSVGGGWGGGGSSTARIFMQLKPRRERTLTAAQVAEKLRPKVSGIPGVRVFMSVPPAIRIGGRMSKSGYELTVSGPDTTSLYAETDKLQRLVAKLDQVQDVTTDLQMKSPRVMLQIDRDKAASLQLNAQQIEGALYDGFGPSWVSTIYGSNTQSRVLLEMDPQFQAHADSLSEIYLKSGTGALVPLNAIVKQKQDTGPQSINHTGQLPSVTISFNLRPGVSLGEAVSEIGDLAKRTLPANFAISFTGTAKAFQSSLSNMGLLLILAIAVVYIVLGVLYESYIHPLTILSGIPAAGFGALLTLLIFGVDLNIYSFVGLIMLIGIVKKNAIMQIDFALAAERNEGKTPAEAIHEGCLARFRPILMTSMAAMLGALPMALGYGSGGEARRPLGVAVVGGLVFSQLITLYLTPVVYTYMAGLQSRRSTKKRLRLLRSLPGRTGTSSLISSRKRAINISETFIRRPIATSLMMVAIALFGAVAYRSLGVSDLPNVDLPTLLITASLPGASPETMASSVATPLENQFSLNAGLDSMTSTNSLGSTQVTLEFDLSRNLDGAAVDVQAAITQSQRLLPQGMPTPPTFTKVNPADQPILYLALTSASLPLYELDGYAETRVAQRISMVSGVAQVQVLGAQKYAVHAQMDPHAMAARRIGINEIEAALKSWNVNLPTGTIQGSRSVPLRCRRPAS